MKTTFAKQKKNINKSSSEHLLEKTKWKKILTKYERSRCSALNRSFTIHAIPAFVLDLNEAFFSLSKYWVGIHLQSHEMWFISESLSNQVRNTNHKSMNPKHMCAEHMHQYERKRNVWRDIMYALAIKCVNGDASAFGTAYRTIGDDLNRWIKKKARKVTPSVCYLIAMLLWCVCVCRCLSCRVVAMRILKSTFGSYDLRSCCDVIRMHRNVQ